MMQQYKTQYGTIFAVREYKGHPAIMLRAERKPDDWSLSSMIEPFTPGAWGMAMYQAGLSPRTINRVIDLLPAVADKYRDLKTDQLADEFFQLTLADRGVNLPETERKQ